MWDGVEQAALASTHGLVPMAVVNAGSSRQWSLQLADILERRELEELCDWYRNGGSDLLLEMDAVPYGSYVSKPLYRRPRKILGVGANCEEVASQLNVSCDEDEPVTFMKPDTTLIGSGDPIVVPVQSSRTTAEAELAIVIGKLCRNVSEQEAVEGIAGYTAALDRRQRTYMGAP